MGCEGKGEGNEGGRVCGWGVQDSRRKSTASSGAAQQEPNLLPVTKATSPSRLNRVGRGASREAMSMQMVVDRGLLQRDLQLDPLVPSHLDSPTQLKCTANNSLPVNCQGCLWVPPYLHM